jgi:glycosyltransferase involved in cell wall biosynthesis
MLIILTTHPIQYQVPLWQALAKETSIPFEVWYLTDHGVNQSYDVQFGKSFAWDLNTLDGYPHRFLNVNAKPDLTRFNHVRLTEPLTKLFREKNVKALWVQGWQIRAYWQAVWQAHAAGIPVWLRAESNDLAPTPAWKRVPKKILLGQFFRRVDHFLYIGAANRRLYESFGIKPEQLHSAPYCVDNERFARQAAELRGQRSEIRRRWRIPEDAFCILFAGKFIHKKRPTDLIEAAKLLLNSDSRLQTPDSRQVHLLFVGSGELGEKMRDACQVLFDADNPSRNGSFTSANGHLPHASFTGFLNQREISKAYVAADCLVLPGRETWGLAVNEAMASGLPCIVSSACGCAEDLVASIRPELKFRFAQSIALSRALNSSIRHSSSIIGNVRTHIEKFHMSSTIDTVQTLYRSGPDQPL